MNVSDQIIEVINDLTAKLGISIDWTQQNVLPQLQEYMGRYIKYLNYKSIGLILLGIILIGMGLSGFYILKIKNISFEKAYFEMLSNGGWLILFSCAIIFVGLCIVTTNVFSLIKINTVPETYFIDHIKTLIR